MTTRDHSHQTPQAWSGAQYWQERFASGDTPWELHKPSSVLLEAVDELTARGVRLSGAKVLSPGCGSGEDALELVRRGADVVAIDWSEEALGRIRAKMAPLSAEQLARITVLGGDVFTVAPVGFDLVAEHTFFCALDPSHRPTYAKTIAAVVKPGGYLFGNFFVLDEDEYRALSGGSLPAHGGPPFAVTEQGLLDLLSPSFSRVVLRPSTRPDPERRAGMEWVGVFQRL